jgi:hypothetical protein
MLRDSVTLLLDEDSEVHGSLLGRSMCSARRADARRGIRALLRDRSRSILPRPARAVKAAITSAAAGERFRSECGIILGRHASCAVNLRHATEE